MASPRWSVERLREEVVLLGARGLPRDEYFAELAPRLRRVIDNDASCWHTLDPHTRLMTSDAPAELIERGVFTAETATAAGELIVRSEYLVPDATRSPSWPRDGCRSGSSTTPRAGTPSAARATGTCSSRRASRTSSARRSSSVGGCGARSTLRDARRAARSRSATRMPSRASPAPIAHGIRASLRFDAARRGSGTEAPGLVVVDAANAVELITPPARAAARRARQRCRWRTRTGRSRRPCSRSRRSSAAARTAPEARATSSPCRARSGWITLHASQPTAGDGRVAIVIEPASGPRSATLRLEISGVTAREREVATLLAARPEQRRDRRRPSCSRRTRCRITSRACSKSSGSPRARSSSHACSSTSTSPRSSSARRSPRADASTNPDRLVVIGRRSERPGPSEHQRLSVPGIEVIAMRALLVVFGRSPDRVPRAGRSCTRRATVTRRPAGSSPARGAGLAAHAAPPRSRPTAAHAVAGISCPSACRARAVSEYSVNDAALPSRMRQMCTCF